jgi:hypothetical protein
MRWLSKAARLMPEGLDLPLSLVRKACTCCHKALTTTQPCTEGLHVLTLGAAAVQVEEVAVGLEVAVVVVVGSSSVPCSQSPLVPPLQ